MAQWQMGNLNRQLRGKDLSIYTLYVHVAAGNTSSALLLVESGDMELQQPCISWAVRSNRTYFSPTSMAIYFHFSTSECNFRTEKEIRKYFKMLQRPSKRVISANKSLHTLCLAFWYLATYEQKGPEMYFLTIINPLLIISHFVGHPIIKSYLFQSSVWRTGC